MPHYVCQVARRQNLCSARSGSQRLQNLCSAPCDSRRAFLLAIGPRPGRFCRACRGRFKRKPDVFLRKYGKQCGLGRACTFYQFVRQRRRRDHLEPLPGDNAHVATGGANSLQGPHGKRRHRSISHFCAPSIPSGIGFIGPIGSARAASVAGCVLWVLCPIGSAAVVSASA
jgi:hypothetical protein